MNGVPFGYQQGEPPAQGRYNTIKIVSIVTDPHGKTTYTVRRAAQVWDGQGWDMFTPSGWMPAREGAS